MKRIILAAMMLSLLLCGNAFAVNYGDIVYNKVNIHVDTAKGYRASYAIYTATSDHEIIPINTKLKVEKGRKGFVLKMMDNGGEKITYEFHKSRMGMSELEYLAIITSSKPIMLDLPPQDMEGVKEGIATVGMTKDGVFHALGYPASHKTKSMDSNKWTYWMNRFRTRFVQFDNNGIVTKVKPEFD